MKHLVITGGNSGIGAAIVQTYLNQGYCVTLTYNKNSPSEFIKEKNVTCIKVDLEKDQDIQSFLKQIGKSRIDVFVNNAALSIKTPYLEISSTELSRVINVNLTSAFKIIQQIFLNMQKYGGGKIINIGSIGGQIGGQYQVHYAVTKGALETLTKSLAKLGFTKKIYAFNLSPGLVDTPMLQSLHEDLSKLCDAVPFGELANPNDLAKTVFDLSLDNWNYASGQTINYNGGLLL